MKSDRKPWYKKLDFDLDLQTGQAAAVKTRNSLKLQEAFKERKPDNSILEVSTKSDTELGKKFSPFNLEKKLPFLHKAFPVENIFHASKVFEKGGPYVDLYGVQPADAKRDPRLKDSGKLLHHQIGNDKYPAHPDILFYNWLYFSALKENPGLMPKLKDYDAFCDIEFNPLTGTNNQARACAIAASLLESGKSSQINSFEDFKNLFLVHDITEIPEPYPADRQKEKIPADQNKRSQRGFRLGDWIRHPAIGRGEIVATRGDNYVIRFPIAGPRTISKEFAEKNCTLISGLDD